MKRGFRIWDKSPIKDGFTGIMINEDYAMQSTYLVDAFKGKYPIDYFIGIYDRDGGRVYENDYINIQWKTEENTVELITYDTNFGYYRYGNNPICELMEDEDILFRVIGNYHQGIVNSKNKKNP